MRRRWTGGSIKKFKIAKRDKAVRQQEYFEKRKGDYGTSIPKRINEAVFQNFLAPAVDSNAQDRPNLDKTEAYMSKDYLLLTSRASNRSQSVQPEKPVLEPMKEEPKQLDPKPVQMPTTIASDMGVMPRIADRHDRVLFIDEGVDRTDEVFRALHTERLLLIQGEPVVHHSHELFPTVVDKLGYNQLLDAALLMREQ